MPYPPFLRLPGPALVATSPSEFPSFLPSQNCFRTVRSSLASNDKLCIYCQVLINGQRSLKPTLHYSIISCTVLRAIPPNITPNITPNATPSQTANRVEGDHTTSSPVRTTSSLQREKFSKSSLLPTIFRFFSQTFDALSASVHPIV